MATITPLTPSTLPQSTLPTLRSPVGPEKQNASEVISQFVEHIEKRLSKRLQQTIQQTIDNSLSKRFEELVLTSPNLHLVVQEKIEGSQQSLERKIDQMREEIRQNQEDVKKIVSSMSSDADTISSIFRMLE